MISRTRALRRRLLRRSFEQEAPVLTRDRERSRSLLYRAGLLADTGNYENWQSIEFALVAVGRLDAPQILSPTHVRHSLDRKCIQTRARMKSFAR